MSDTSEGEPRVRPEESSESSTPQPRPPATTLITAFLAAAVAALVLFIAFDSDSDSDGQSPTSLGETAATTAPINAVTTSSFAATDSTATGTVEEVASLNVLLPDVNESTLTVVSGQELVHWTPTAPRSTSTIPILNGPVLEFDESGQHMAFLGPSAADDGSVLYVGTWDSWAPAAIGVSSFRWHDTVWGRLGWLQPGDPPVICSAQVVDEGVLSPSSCIDGTAEEIVGFDSEGFLLVDHTNRRITRLDPAGREVQTIRGTNAIVGPDGRVLVMERSPDGADTTFSMARSDLSEVTALDWAPRTAHGAYGTVAWSSVNIGGPRLAFLAYDDSDGWHVELFDSDGTPYGTIALGGRVWDIAWDSTGRYLLVPGVIDESEHTLQIYDTFPESLYRLRFDTWIQDASLVTEARCLSAAQVVAAFANRLPDDVALGASQMVRSRDANLESWYFISALVDGGQFDSAVASWAVPGFEERSVDSVNTPNLSIPINETAAFLGFGMTRELPTDYGVDDWFQLDGARASQACLPKVN